ncbi:MAG: OmpA family protein [Lewinellaceae bacterium]|nr:OmpA family protein [Lewinellaceae bacterium]
MVGQTKSGRTVVKESSMHMVLWTPLKDAEGMRFSVIFGFNESRTIDIYEKYLTDIVTPKIPRDGKVIIRGFTDIIGDESNNQTLSLARANEVCYIMQNSLSKAGRYDVTFEVAGFGENETLSPFENKYPEERFYNRCVTIDIIPVK